MKRYSPLFQLTWVFVALSTHNQSSGSGNIKLKMECYLCVYREEGCAGVSGEGLYACLVRMLQMEESQDLEERIEPRKATIGAKLGLQVILDQHSNLDSIATRFDNDNSFKVHIGQPTAFPMLGKDQLTLSTGKYIDFFINLYPMFRKTTHDTALCNELE